MISKSLTNHNRRILSSMLDVIYGKIDHSKIIFEDKEGNRYTISNPELYTSIVMDLEEASIANGIEIIFNPYKIGKKNGCLTGEIAINCKKTQKIITINSYIDYRIVKSDDTTDLRPMGYAVLKAIHCDLWLDHSPISSLSRFIMACIQYNRNTDKISYVSNESISSEDIYSIIRNYMASNNYSEEDMEKVINIVSPVIEDMIREYNSLHYFKDSKELKPATRIRKR